MLPSRYEPFGNVHLEALASGLPVIASARAGGSEVIEEGVNGYVVDPDDPKAIAEALERIRSGDPTTLRAAARRSAEPFSYRAQVAAFGEIYQNVRQSRGNLR